MKYLLTDVTGIGESTSALMLKHGIDSVKTLCESDVETLCLIPGFGAIRAVATLNAALLLQAPEHSSEGADVKRSKKAQESAKPKAEKVKKAAKSSKKDKKEPKQSKKMSKKKAKSAKKDKKVSKKTKKPSKTKKSKS
ncbi:MAG: helix-hairpin-helix domain-containing protein [Ghiorsea sp.]|nr:helix-hairpin-helix domain-containing protein [Ghiorsea sp.]